MDRNTAVSPCPCSGAWSPSWQEKNSSYLSTIFSCYNLHLLPWIQLTILWENYQIYRQGRTADVILTDSRKDLIFSHLTLLHPTLDIMVWMSGQVDGNDTEMVRLRAPPVNGSLPAWRLATSGALQVPISQLACLAHLHQLCFTHIASHTRTSWGLLCWNRPWAEQHTPNAASGAREEIELFCSAFNKAK